MMQQQHLPTVTHHANVAEMRTRQHSPVGEHSVKVIVSEQSLIAQWNDVVNLDNTHRVTRAHHACAHTYQHRFQVSHIVSLSLKQFVRDLVRE
jgi:hypothetical protein